MKRHNFKKLQIWQEAMDLIDENYILTKTLPDFERFGLQSQMNRSAVSIASNISEGTSKNSDKHFIKYLLDSLGSSFEWETHLIICYRQQFVNKEKFLELEKQIKILQKKISNFIDSLDR